MGMASTYSNGAGGVKREWSHIVLPQDPQVHGLPPAQHPVRVG
jgi:hypothetical protein